MHVAFLYLDKDLNDFHTIERKMIEALQRLVQKSEQQTTPPRRRAMKKLLSTLLIWPHPLLQGGHIAHAAALVPLCAHLLAVCHRRHTDTRPLQRLVAGHPSAVELPSLGRQRLRSGSPQVSDPTSTPITTVTGAIISTTPEEFRPQPGKYYSVGLHPWSLSDTSKESIARLEAAVQHEQVVAVGETGLDKLKGGVNYEEQLIYFEKQIRLSEQWHKPLVIHAVKSYDDIIRIHKAKRPAQPWIIHGFRGKPETAGHSSSARGLFLSFGEYYNHETLKSVPLDRLFLETDEGNMTIDKLYRKAAHIRNQSPRRLHKALAGNIARIFPLEQPTRQSSQPENIMEYVSINEGVNKCRSHGHNPLDRNYYPPVALDPQEHPPRPRQRHRR